MAAWNDGYVHDVAYTAGFYREIAPAWISAAAMLLGHRPPDLSRPFRWAELGCGHGLSANILAAARWASEACSNRSIAAVFAARASVRSTLWPPLTLPSGAAGRACS